MGIGELLKEFDGMRFVDCVPETFASCIGGFDVFGRVITNDESARYSMTVVEPDRISPMIARDTLVVDTLYLPMWLCIQFVGDFSRQMCTERSQSVDRLYD